MLDTLSLSKGADYSQLRENYVIFITENDVLSGGKPLYHIERKIEETNELFNDGSHIIFVNGKYRGEDAIGYLMHDFRCSEVENIHYDMLARRIDYFKNSEEGESSMCRMMEEMLNENAAIVAARVEAESRVNTIGKLNEKGFSVQEIAEIVELPADEVMQCIERLNP